MKNILMLAHDDDGQEARLQAALDLTRLIDGHLTCLDVVEVPVLMGDAMGRGGHGIMVAESRLVEAAHREQLRGRLERENVSWDWVDAAGDIASCVADAADLADCIVASAHVKGVFGSPIPGVAADILVRSNKPVLAVPEARRGLGLDRALVAWNGSRSSAAAMQAAVPLLAHASLVLIQEIDDGHLGEPAEEAAAYLARHSIKSAILRSEAGDIAIANQILGQAYNGGSDLLVMGGYEHGKLGEALLAGVARTVLARAHLPVFMAR